MHASVENFRDKAMKLSGPMGFKLTFLKKCG